MSNLVVIGGCGRIGLRLSLIAANKGHNVVNIDIDEERINELKHGSLPFREKNAEIYLEQALKTRALRFTLDYGTVSKADIVIITIGTPVDSNLNPSLEPVAGVIFDISEFLKKGQLIVFRNILSPEIVNRIKTLIEDKTGYTVGKDIYLAFAPEMLEEDLTIHDLATIPQPIGAYDKESFSLAEKFFKTITKGKISWLTPQEALLTKLMQNMRTYVQNALANEFYLIAESFNTNFHKILNASKNEYYPNPNCSNSGVHKEGWFLVNRTPFSDLVTGAFKINESMISVILQKLEPYKPNKVAILGMTNSADSDDPKSSLSYKLRKSLYYKNYEVACYDPYLPEYSDSGSLYNADALILMTPHKDFASLNGVMKLVKNPTCLIIDIQGFWEETREKGVNGFWKFSEVKSNLKEKEKKKK